MPIFTVQITRLSGTRTLIFARMEEDQRFVLVQWTKDPGFSWSVVPRQHVYLPGTGECRLHGGMIVKAKWKSSRLEAKVLAWDGKSVNCARHFLHPCVSVGIDGYNIYVYV